MNLELEKIKPGLAEIARKHNLRFIALFGTAGSGAMRETSDIDVAVLRIDRQALSSGSFMDIMSELSEIIGSGFRTVDLVDLAKANILLRYEIMTSGVPLFGDEDDYRQYKIFALNEYLDSQSLRRLESELIKKRQVALGHKIYA